MSASTRKALTLGGLVIALGVVFGDIGTSPLYTIRATLALAGGTVTKDVIFGIVSLIFWTLTLQTTIKYVTITLKADNKGEGGIFSLYTLVKEKKNWLVFIAIIGGATLLADGIITPAITVTSAIEGLKLVVPGLQQNTVIMIVIGILTALFLIQRFGTSAVGKMFGPLMIIWFSFIGGIGIYNLRLNLDILWALNPYYGFKLLVTNPVGVLILGGVFLCTTGAEALYSDLGHCGRQNIKISWIFVKIMLVANYFGQGAYLLKFQGETLKDVNPFFSSIPESLMFFAVIIATIAAIIASQALISGSFTLVSEAIKLNLFPKIQTVYPTDIKGQIYIPMITLTLWAGATGVVLFFGNSEHMEAAYGLAITITMLMTTLLLSFYLSSKMRKRFVIPIIGLFVTIESVFLFANLQKFLAGGYITIGIAAVLMFVMYVWYKGFLIKIQRYSFVPIADFSDQFEELVKDPNIPLFASNLVFLSDVENPEKVERKIIYSILNNIPKRAQHYWFVHVKVTDEPYTREYHINRICPHSTKITFRLGFRVNQKINHFLKFVIADLIKHSEIDPQPRKYSINRHEDPHYHVMMSDMRFVILKEYLSNYNDLNFFENLVVKAKFFIKKFTVSPVSWFGLENSSVVMESAPMIIGAPKKVELQRVDK